MNNLETPKNSDISFLKLLFWLVVGQSLALLQVLSRKLFASSTKAAITERDLCCTAGGAFTGGMQIRMGPERLGSWGEVGIALYYSHPLLAQMLINRLGGRLFEYLGD